MPRRAPDRPRAARSIRNPALSLAVAAGTLIAAGIAPGWVPAAAADDVVSTGVRTVANAKAVAAKASARSGAAQAAIDAASNPATPAPARAGQTRTASASSPIKTVSASRPARGAASKPADAVAPQDERVTYHYNALGRRDPFQPLLGGGFVGADEGGNAAPDVGGIKVVGIVWGAEDKFALVEDPRGNSLVLRQGDKVMNGYVESLKRDAVIVSLTTDGVTQQVTIPLTRKGEQSK